MLRSDTFLIAKFRNQRPDGKLSFSAGIRTPFIELYELSVVSLDSPPVSEYLLL